MANLKAIRKRIASVKSTQQITRAMRMVAAAKLRKAQDRIVAAKPYAEKMEEMAGNLAIRAGEIKHPLLETRDEVKRVLLVSFSSDRGLCGAFNNNLIKAAEKFTKEVRDSGQEATLICVGTKSFDYFKKRKYEIREKYLNIGSENDFDTAQVIARDVISAYTEKEFDRVAILFSEFYSPMRQTPVLKELFPISTGADQEEEPAGGLLAEYIFEPPAADLLEKLLPKFVEVQIYRGILDNLASEHGARMTAMENATSNADDMIKDLTLTFNKARQESITRELMDIVGGAEAQAK